MRREGAVKPWEGVEGQSTSALIMSRIVDRQMLMNPSEKECFRKVMGGGSEVNPFPVWDASELSEVNHLRSI